MPWVLAKGARNDSNVPPLCQWQLALWKYVLKVSKTHHRFESVKIALSVCILCVSSSLH